jgi:hypothetical protein
VLRDLIEDHLPEVSKKPESLSNPEK